MNRLTRLAPPPEWIRPQLTELVDAAPEGQQWLHEIKYDGYRMHARLDRGEVRLRTRNGLDLDGEDLTSLPLIERKERLAGLLSQAGSPLHYSDYQIGLGRAFYEHACALKVEGIVSKRADAPYVPGNRGLWLKVKCLNREEFVVIGWTDPEGAWPFLGALLLGYYDPKAASAPASTRPRSNGCGGGLQPLAVAKMPLDVPPPRSTRFRSPLVLSRVHWFKPELVVEVKFNLLRQVVYEGLREDKPAAEVRRDVPHPKSGAVRKSRRLS